MAPTDLKSPAQPPRSCLARLGPLSEVKITSVFSRIWGGEDKKNFIFRQAPIKPYLSWFKCKYRCRISAASSIGSGLFLAHKIFRDPGAMSIVHGIKSESCQDKHRMSSLTFSLRSVVIRVPMDQSSSARESPNVPRALWSWNFPPVSLISCKCRHGH